MQRQRRGSWKDFYIANLKVLVVVLILLLSSGVISSIHVNVSVCINSDLTRRNNNKQSEWICNKERDVINILRFLIKKSTGPNGFTGESYHLKKI